MDSQRYFPSLSTGIYGSYTIQHKNDGEANVSHDTGGMCRGNDIDDYKADEQYKANPKEKFFADNDDTDIPIKPIYNAAKQIDDKYKLIFKPECNYKGCCNKPEIDPSLLKGDMYICKKHRIEMASRMKQSNNSYLKSFILKLQTYDDQQFYEEGKQLEDNDYFLRGYSKSQQAQLQIAKKLSKNKNKMSPEYWEDVIRYKQLQQQSKLLVTIRKISNPFFVIAVVVIFAAAVIGGAWLLSKMLNLGENRYVAEYISDAELENMDKIKQCEDAFKALKKDFLENDKLKKKCIKEIKDIDGQIERIEADYQKELKAIQDELDTETKGANKLNDDINQMEEKINNMDDMDQLLDMMVKVQKMEDKKMKHEEEMKKKEVELQRKKEEFAKSEAARKKTELEAEKRRIQRELEQREREEDELNYKRAKNRVEYLARNTSSGWVTVYIVYDVRKYFWGSWSCAYSASRDQNYDQYGNWKICKLEGKYYEDHRNTFWYETSGRSYYWYMAYNGHKRTWTDGDKTYIEL